MGTYFRYLLGKYFELIYITLFTVDYLTQIGTITFFLCTYFTNNYYNLSHFIRLSTISLYSVLICYMRSLYIIDDLTLFRLKENFLLKGKKYLANPIQTI